MNKPPIMQKVRQWDTRLSKWLMRHVYFIFFQFVLVAIFIMWFVNTFHVIDISVDLPTHNVAEKMVKVQTTSQHILVFLVIINSFWMLFILNSLQRIHRVLKDVSYNITKLRRQSAH